MSKKRFNFYIYNWITEPYPIQIKLIPTRMIEKMLKYIIITILFEKYNGGCNMACKLTKHKFN